MMSHTYSNKTIFNHTVPGSGYQVQNTNNVGYSVNPFSVYPAPNSISANDIILNGESLKQSLQSINNRLAILTDPDPEKLKKFAALKEAYDHYKMVEMLINEENERKD